MPGHHVSALGRAPSTGCASESGSDGQGEKYCQRRPPLQWSRADESRTRHVEAELADPGDTLKCTPPGLG